MKTYSFQLKKWSIPILISGLILTLNSCVTYIVDGKTQQTENDGVYFDPKVDKRVNPVRISNNSNGVGSPYFVEESSTKVQAPYERNSQNNQSDWGVNQNNQNNQSDWNQNQNNNQNNQSDWGSNQNNQNNNFIISSKLKDTSPNIVV